MIGRIVREIELQTLENGTSVAKTSLAVKRDYLNKSGEREADFFFITLFGKRAEIFSQYLNKGCLVFVSGTLKNNHYEKNSQKVYQNEFIVKDFEFLESKIKNEERRNKSLDTNTELENFETATQERKDNQLVLSAKDLPF
jgi:single-strand DNA-binding protein